MFSAMPAIVAKAIALSTAASGFLVPLVFPLPAQPIHAQIFEGTNGCPIGTQEGSRNFVLNGHLQPQCEYWRRSDNCTCRRTRHLSFFSELPYRGDSVYPDDPMGGLSIKGDLTRLCMQAVS
jgi:hypothetical protein